MRITPFIIFALVLVVTGISYPLSFAMAAQDDDLSASGLLFRVDAAQDGLFTVAARATGEESVRYALDTRTISFRLIDTALDGFDNPLFCFDFAELPAAQLRLMVRNASDQVVLDNVGLDSALQYNLSAGELGFLPGASTRCFYYGSGDEPTFGLFGRPAPTRADDPDDLVFGDGFEIFTDISVRFEDVPESVVAGSIMSYRLVIENTGDNNFSELAFQEVFPGNRSVFAAALDAGTWTCTGASCPAATGSGLIRFQGQTLPAEQSMVFEISRPVDAGSTPGSLIPMYAGAISGFGVNAVFDVARTETGVLGPPTQLAFTNDSSAVGINQTKVLVIQIQDANGNLVPTATRLVEISKVLGSGDGQVSPMTGLVQVTNGFVNLPVVGTIAGQLTLAVQTPVGASNPLPPATTTFAVTAQ